MHRIAVVDFTADMEHSVDSFAADMVVADSSAAVVVVADMVAGTPAPGRRLAGRKLVVLDLLENRHRRHLRAPVALLVQTSRDTVGSTSNDYRRLGVYLPAKGCDNDNLVIGVRQKSPVRKSVSKRRNGCCLLGGKGASTLSRLLSFTEG